MMDAPTEHTALEAEYPIDETPGDDGMDGLETTEMIALELEVGLAEGAKGVENGDASQSQALTLAAADMGQQESTELVEKDKKATYIE